MSPYPSGWGVTSWYQSLGSRWVLSHLRSSPVSMLMWNWLATGVSESEWYIPTASTSDISFLLFWLLEFRLSNPCFPKDVLLSTFESFLGSWVTYLLIIESWSIVLVPILFLDVNLDPRSCSWSLTIWNDKLDGRSRLLSEFASETEWFRLTLWMMIFQTDQTSSDLCRVSSDLLNHQLILILSHYDKRSFYSAVYSWQLNEPMANGWYTVSLALHYSKPRALGMRIMETSRPTVDSVNWHLPHLLLSFEDETSCKLGRV
jgi:hypothetical protein